MKHKQTHGRTLLKAISFLLFLSGSFLIFFCIQEGWYPTGYNGELIDGEKYILERGWSSSETLIIEEDASDDLEYSAAMTNRSISLYQSSFTSMGLSFYSFYFTFIPILFHLKTWDKKTMNKRLLSSGFVLLVTAFLTYHAMTQHNEVEEDWTKVEQQLSEQSIEGKIQE